MKAREPVVNMLSSLDFYNVVQFHSIALSLVMFIICFLLSDKTVTALPLQILHKSARISKCYFLCINYFLAEYFQ